MALSPRYSSSSCGAPGQRRHLLNKTFHGHGVLGIVPKIQLLQLRSTWTKTTFEDKTFHWDGVLCVHRVSTEFDKPRSQASIVYVHYIEQKDCTHSWVTRKEGYMRDSLYKSLSGRLQHHRPDCIQGNLGKAALYALTPWLRCPQYTAPAAAEHLGKDDLWQTNTWITF